MALASRSQLFGPSNALFCECDIRGPDGQAAGVLAFLAAMNSGALMLQPEQL